MSNKLPNAAGLIAPQQLNAITQAIAGLDANQLTWVSGYLAGLAASGNVATHAASAEASKSESSLTVLYGSQTGNAKGIAQAMQSQAEEQGIASKLVSMADYKPRQIKSETHLAIVVSTHGEGDAPDDAAELHEFLASKKAPKLPDTQYAVLGLGDTSYEFFCQTAKDFDARLANLGAKSIVSRVECDVDYEEAAKAWTESVLAKVKETFSTSKNLTGTAGLPVSSEAAGSATSYTKKSPFSATLATVQKITGRDSVKDIQHVEISLEESGIQYQPGDAVGVWFKNDPVVVDEILSLTQADGESMVKVGELELSLREALISRLELTLSYPGFVKAYQGVVNNPDLQEIVTDNGKLRAFLADRQIIDVVRQYPGKIEADELVKALRPLTPRLYSIASSQSEVDEEVHLTVGHVDYMAFDTRHQGGASGFLCDRMEEGELVDVYIEPNQNFRLPDDPNTPIIMVGPGTGIAPFRAFMQERDVQEAEGKNWLFFGNPNFTQDFLYQTEWQGYKKSGLLTHLSLAFSRDQAEKIYVQHRLLEQGEEVFKWLQDGAHFYVCGDANQMAKDVEQALLSIVETHGKMSESDAKQYVVDLRKAKRYQKDVY